MKLARLFLAVVTAGTLAACNNSVTTPDTTADAPAFSTSDCDGTLVTSDTGEVKCMPALGSGG